MNKYLKAKLMLKVVFQTWETFVVKKLSYYCFKMSEFISDCINSLNILKRSGIKYGVRNF